MLNSLFESIRSFPLESLLAVLVSVFGSVGSIKVFQVLFEFLFKNRKKIMALVQSNIDSLEKKIYKKLDDIVGGYNEILEKLDNLDIKSDDELKNILKSYIDTVLEQDIDLKLQFNEKVGSLSKKLAPAPKEIHNIESEIHKTEEIHNVEVEIQKNEETKEDKAKTNKPKVRKKRARRVAK